MKRLILILIVALSLSYVFGLSAGDIAIIAVNADAPKSMVFVALVDIPASTTITFTDNAWNASTQVWRTGEASIAWSNSSVTAKGTVVTISMGAPTSPFTVDVGTVTTNTTFNMSTTGDQVLAYEGATAPTTNSSSLWLYGFSLENWVWGNNTNTSDIPTALAGASVGMTSSATEFDNAYFANGSTSQTTVTVSGTKAELLTLFNDNSKYYKNDAGPLTYPTYSITVSSGAGPSITATGALNAFSTTSGTASAYQSYKVSGANLTADITVTAPSSYELCKTSGGTYTSGLTFTPSSGTVAEQDVFVRIAASAGAGSPSGNITHTSTGATQVDKSVSGTVYKTEPSSHVTNFMADTGSLSYSVIDAVWDDATGSVVPDGYLIKGSDVGYSSISDPSDGVAEENTTLVKNVAAGVETASFTGLTEHTTYYFKIFPYTNSGANINYKVNDTVPTDSQITAYGPPSAPTATSATAVSHEGFTAHWNSVSGATSYRVDVLEGAMAVATDLFISEYVEGSSNNKYIEIFNGTGASVDLSEYYLKLFPNGALETAPNPRVQLSGTLANGECIVYKNSSAVLTLPDGVTAITNAAVNFNGDDALLLMKKSGVDSTYVDVFGWIGSPDPGTQWGTSPLWTINTTLVRKSSVTAGVTSNPVSGTFETLTTEWDYYAQDTASYLGSHTMGTALTPITGWNNKAVNNTVVRVPGLDPSSDYSYRVRAVNDNGTSSNSNVVEVSTVAVATGSGANTAIGGASTVILVPALSGFTDNTVEIDPSTTTNDDITVAVATGDGTITFSFTGNDAALSGLYLLNHVGLGFTPVDVTVNDGTIVEWYGDDESTFVEISDFGAKGTLIITLSEDEPLPVVLSSFSAVLNAQNNVNILWITQTETNLTGFYILRADNSDFSSALELGFIDPTNTSLPQSYLFTDNSLVEPGTYYYWLQIAEMDGSNSLHGPTTISYTNQDNPGVSGVPLVTELKSVFPNPFNPTTTISYGIAKATDVKISIYNSRGQVVRTFNEGTKAANSYRLNWNGKDNNGKECSTGIYYIKMQAGKDSFTRKAVLMK
jgi:hypothetical protein